MEYVFDTIDELEAEVIRRARIELVNQNVPRHEEVRLDLTCLGLLRSVRITDERLNSYSKRIVEGTTFWSISHEGDANHEYCPSCNSAGMFDLKGVYTKSCNSCGFRHS